MKNYNRYFKIMIGITLLILLGACEKEKAREEKPRGVKLIEVGKIAEESRVVLSGVVIPQKESVLSFKIPGKIAELKVDKGTFVKKGEILAELEKRDYQLNIEVSEKKYQAATENYRAASAASENAKLQFERIDRLYREKATTKKIHDEITAKYRGAIASENATLALKDEAKKGIENARNKLKDSEMRAPYDGYVDVKLSEEGAVVNSGTPILKLMSKESPEVSLNISENEFSTLQSAERISFKHKEKEYPLILKGISKKPTMSKLSYLATLKFQEPEEFIAGTPGEIIIFKRGNQAQEIRLPLTAIFENSGTKVWIYKNGVLSSRGVEIEKLADGGEVIIKSGLSPNEIVVAAGVTFMYEGEKVRPIHEPSKTNIGQVL